MNELFDTFNGIPVIESPHIPEFSPVIELSHKVTVSTEFRNKTNKWYLEMFGRKRTVWMVNGKMITHPNTVRILRTQAMENKL